MEIYWESSFFRTSLATEQTFSMRTHVFQRLLGFFSGKLVRSRVYWILLQGNTTRVERFTCIQLVDKVRKSGFLLLLPVAPLCSWEIRVKIFTATFYFRSGVQLKKYFYNLDRNNLNSWILLYLILTSNHGNNKKKRNSIKDHRKLLCNSFLNFLYGS